MANLIHGDSAWTSEQTQSTKSKTYTFSTANKYVDKDIALTVSAQDGSVKVAGGGLTHGEITTTDTTYLTDTNTGYPVTFSNNASRGAVTYNATTSTAGWVDGAEDFTGLSATSTDTKTLTKYVVKGTASVTGNQSITTNPTITFADGKIKASYSGSKSISGSVSKNGWITSVSSASVSTSGSAEINPSDLDSNLKASNIIKGVTIFGITGTGASNKDVVFSNKATEHEDGTKESYTDISDDVAALFQGDYLYVNEGYTTNKKISLAKLVPDGTTVQTDTSSPLIYKTVTARNDDGKLIAGTMDDASVKSGTSSIASVSVASSAEASGTNAGKYKLTATVNVTAPTVTTGGYITSSIGTKSANNSQSNTAYLNAGAYNVSGGGLTAGSGSSSINVNGLYNATSKTVSTTDTITLSTSTPTTNDYYKIGTTGKGTVNRGAITKQNTTAGWIPSQSSATNVSDATSLSSNSGTSTYYVKKSSGETQTKTPSKSSQTVTIGAGYYPTDRTITINAIDPTSSSQVTQGAISANDSTISSVTATSGTATTDTTNWKYKIPLTLSASGTAYAKVTTSGYVTSAKNTSKSLSGSGSVEVSLNMYDGAFTIA